jgi:hypothetical protein
LKEQEGLKTDMPLTLGKTDSLFFAPTARFRGNIEPTNEIKISYNSAPQYNMIFISEKWFGVGRA